MNAATAGGPKVTLTFDNGPDPQGTTAAVLDLLLARDCKATFFATGKQLALPGARALAERAHAEGHWIGNHTFNHATIFGDSADTELPAKEIGATQALLAGIAHPAKLFRPYGGGIEPGPGLLSIAAIDYLVQGKYSLVLWNCVPRDWEGTFEWVDRCIDDVLTRPWSVIVLHDLPAGGTQYLGLLLDRLDALEASVVQEFPVQCVPIREGCVQGDVTGLCRAAKAD